MDIPLEFTQDGSGSASFGITCRFPALRLNVGRFHLRTHLTGPPGGEIKEAEGVCAFEIARTDDLWVGSQRSVLTMSSGVGT
jgi:hypothetical protein